MPIIDIPEIAIAKVEESLSIDTKIHPTQLVRAALLFIQQSNLSKEQIFALIGQSATDTALIDSLETKK